MRKKRRKNDEYKEKEKNICMRKKDKKCEYEKK
jgi:hypothetical protein